VFRIEAIEDISDVLLDRLETSCIEVDGAADGLVEPIELS
jgi:hypothetical protein